MIPSSPITIGNRTFLQQSSPLDDSENKVLAEILEKINPTEIVNISTLSPEEQKKKAIAAFLLLSLEKKLTILSLLNSTQPNMAEKLKNHIKKPRITHDEYQQRSSSPQIPFSSSQNTSSSQLQPGGNTKGSIIKGLGDIGYEKAIGQQRATAATAMANSQKKQVSFSTSAVNGISSKAGWAILAGVGGTCAIGAGLS